MSKQVKKQHLKEKGEKSEKLILEDDGELEEEDHFISSKKDKKGKEKIIKGGKEPFQGAMKKKPKKKNVTAPLQMSTYINRILKQIHNDIGISKQGMQVMNDIVSNAFFQLLEEASKLIRMDRHDTLGVRDLISAVRLVMPGEIAAEMIEEGQNHLRSYLEAEGKHEEIAKLEKTLIKRKAPATGSGMIFGR